jgi:hypothetical protein
VELGFNAISGSTDRLSARVGLGLRRQTPETITTSNFAYNYGRDNRGLSEDRARLDLRNDWIQQAGSGWRYYVNFTGEYDTFQAWDWRVGGSLGIGYDLIKEKDLTLIGRAGLGASRELGRIDNTVRPEITPGLDLEWRIDDRMKLISGLDYYRDLDHFEVYRFVARSALEVSLNEKNTVFLRMGVESRYDEAAGFPRENNDVEVFTSVIFRF